MGQLHLIVPRILHATHLSGLTSGEHVSMSKYKYTSINRKDKTKCDAMVIKSILHRRRRRRRLHFVDENKAYIVDTCTAGTQVAAQQTNPSRGGEPDTNAPIRYFGAR